MKIAVCGGGNAAHLLIPAIKQNSEAWVGVLAPYGDEAQRFSEGVAEGGVKATYQDGREVWGKPDLITKFPAEIIPDADLVIIAAPAFTHTLFVDMVSPYIKQKAWLGAIPSRSGFEFYCNRKEIKEKQITLFGFQTLPWACRIAEYGRKITVLGQKTQVELAAKPAGRSQEIADVFRELLGLPVVTVSSMGVISLGNVGQIIHPGIMVGLFRGRENTVFAEKEIPLFYQGVTDSIAQVLEGLSREVQEIAAVLSAKTKGLLKAGEIKSLKDWLIDSYIDSIQDSSSLAKCFNTNAAYRGLKAPMVPDGSGGYRPDFKSRYLTEDVPYGLLVTKGIADLCGVRTEAMDDVIAVSSAWMGYEYYNQGRPTGRDIASSRHPVNFGITSINQLADSIF